MNINYDITQTASLREQIGKTLIELGQNDKDVVVLDAEVGNSTFTLDFQKVFPDRFFEMYISEQTMMSAALGLSLRGKKPFVATFGAFLSRAFDQIRMSSYSAPKTNLKIIGTHSGVSIGEDGPSQMALEDIAIFRTLLDSVILYPSDAISTQSCLNLMRDFYGISYLRVTRESLPQLYPSDEQFKIGGSKTLLGSDNDQITLISAGITLHECLKAAMKLQKQGINSRVIDLYSIKPIDVETLNEAASKTKSLIVVEDHYQAGGIFEAICSNVKTATPIHSLCVRKTPRSGTKDELLAFEAIDSKAIIDKAQEYLSRY